MQTQLADFIRDTPEGREADAILRKCVHCGFCTATCPTYQLLGDELDGPRGRIYLMKNVLEGERVSERTQLHLDRCLTCRSCETTCPSGVEYGRLLDIVRNLVEQRVERPWWQRAQRAALTNVLPRASLFSPLLGLGRIAKPYLPNAIAGKVPGSPPDGGRWPAPRHARRMIALAGCVQPALAPDINAAAARVLDRLGISLIETRGAGCCGALRYHLNQQREGLEDMRRLIDAWWPPIEAAGKDAAGGVEAIVMTGSGCGAMVRDYAHLFERDPRYREKAARISAMTRDICEVVDAQIDTLRPLVANTPARRVAFHPPCTLQHAQKIRGVTERVLAAAGFELTPVPDAHLCCGSAGTYSILQPELAGQLKRNKLAALGSGMPEMILSSNIGCQSHLADGAQVRVTHWIVALDERLTGQTGAMNGVR
ncbi:MAG: glycolate oxidase iron-sulfur subunit [Betaproteobacteria bacterium RIFCSPLOWO2_12_FULL_63_13]|nr:MAG: glycolate oxidase iron-sulfur subunit [Betaproteobacteria bacterium RIFCSPLOWO2_02_FULL_63_19]OGA50850.1 MAG: glycolate oxidase iron-sulfur subunit [Betaproteobacteria bacterium RIFCSPLOWO2_12_FULL_63_13]